MRFTASRALALQGPRRVPQVPFGPEAPHEPRNVTVLAQAPWGGAGTGPPRPDGGACCPSGSTSCCRAGPEGAAGTWGARGPQCRLLTRGPGFLSPRSAALRQSLLGDFPRRAALLRQERGGVAHCDVLGEPAPMKLRAYGGNPFEEGLTG
jgi:hypothetical protein